MIRLLIIILLFLNKRSKGLPLTQLKVEDKFAEQNTDYTDDYQKDNEEEELPSNPILETSKFVSNLDNLLEWFYEQYMNDANKNADLNNNNETIHTTAKLLEAYDQMQSDQPQEDVLIQNNEPFKENDVLKVFYENLSTILNITNSKETNLSFDNEYHRAMLRNRSLLNKTNSDLNPRLMNFKPIGQEKYENGFSLVTIIIIGTVLTRTTESVPVQQQLAGENTSSDEDFDYEDNSEKISPKSDANSDLELIKFEKVLDNFAEWYYEKYINVKFPNGSNSESDMDQMQADQPQEYDNGVNVPQTYKNDDSVNPVYQRLSSMVDSTSKFAETRNFTDIDYLRVMRNRRHNQLEIRTKDIWIQMLKDNILRKIGRTNSSMPTSNNEIEFQTFNLSQFLPASNETLIDDESIGEKIRSYYPSCELPRNTDQDVWKDENAMNLYFNVDQAPEENTVSIATATLRLYRLPQQNLTTASIGDSSCENSSVIEDDKLLRISIYWYTKSLKKHRVKRRLSDSKVIGENAQYVELSVRPATRAWSKGRNLGLAVLVEDQEGTLLKADRYFKGASCTVGTSTPKPIPTVIVDAARRAEMERSIGANGTNSSTALYNYISLLPKIDICTLQFPQNYSIQSISLNNLRINKCNLAKIHNQTQKLLERERMEKLAALATYSPPHRHIRHQRQHLQDMNDPRSKVVGQKSY